MANVRLGSMIWVASMLAENRLDGLAGFGGKMRGLLVGVLATTLLSGCAQLTERDGNIMIGAGVGAGAGALIGSTTAGPPGVLPGEASGPVTGGVIGSVVSREVC